MKPAALGATLLLHTAALGGFYHFSTTAPAAYTGQPTYTVALLPGGHPSTPAPTNQRPPAKLTSGASTDAALSTTATPSSGPAHAADFAGVSLSADYAGTNPKPHYPLLSRKLAEQGTVVLRILVREDGSAGEVRIQQSSGYPLLDASALSAVKQWRFHPASMNRRPIAEWYQVAIPFKLQQ